MARLLLVEDEAKVRRSLQKGLEEEGYEVVAVDNGNDGRHQASTQPFDCLILDLMLPGRDGLEILQRVRAAGRQTPTIILTARGAIEDRVRGLDAGADDYLPKPFAFAELLARIRVCLRRGSTLAETVLRAGDLSLDCIHRRVVQADKEIDLTAREFELLEYLMKHRGEVVTREMIARDVWREPPGTMTNVIDVYINYVRKKLERAGNARLIHTIRGIGYQFGGDE
ncbi:MAG: DNA-binding response regulator [Planctomycetes bacterium RBG_16_64_10]|nr:MAG: DNA-binding response regulator [Planctomycetes bacterium RBG_16_64_10]